MSHLSPVLATNWVIIDTLRMVGEASRSTMTSTDLAVVRAGRPLELTRGGDLRESFTQRHAGLGYKPETTSVGLAGNRRPNTGDLTNSQPQ